MANSKIEIGPLRRGQINFYIAFNLFRLAAIFHGIKGRLIRGTAASQNAEDRVKAMPTVIALAREAMEACETV